MLKVDICLQTWKQMGCLKAHETKEYNRETSKTKLPAAFQGCRNVTFSLQACKLHTSGLPRSARLKVFLRFKESAASSSSVVLYRSLIEEGKIKLYNIIITDKEHRESRTYSQESLSLESEHNATLNWWKVIGSAIWQLVCSQWSNSFNRVGSQLKWHWGRFRHHTALLKRNYFGAGLCPWLFRPARHNHVNDLWASIKGGLTCSALLWRRHV